MRITIAIAVAFLMAAMIGTPAYSSNITVIAQGVFSQFTDPDGLLPFPQPDPGAVFQIRFTYASTTPDRLPTFSWSGSYQDAISDMLLIIGASTFGNGGI